MKSITGLDFNTLHYFWYFYLSINIFCTKWTSMKILWLCMFHSTWQNIVICFSKILCEFSLQCLFKSYHEFRLHHILFYLKVTLSYNDEWHYLSTDLVFIMYWSIKRESLTGKSYFIQTRIDNMKTYDSSFSIRMCIKSLIGILYKS